VFVSYVVNVMQLVTATTKWTGGVAVAHCALHTKYVVMLVSRAICEVGAVKGSSPHL